MVLDNPVSEADRCLSKLGATALSFELAFLKRALSNDDIQCGLVATRAGTSRGTVVRGVGILTIVGGVTGVAYDCLAARLGRGDRAPVGAEGIAINGREVVVGEPVRRAVVELELIRVREFASEVHLHGDLGPESDLVGLARFDERCVIDTRRR